MFFFKEITSYWRFSFLFSLFISLLGLLPHALFSLNVGAWHFMSNAWDEDTYTRFALLHQDVIYRTLSAALVRGLIRGVGLDGARIIIDMLLPFCCALVAVGISYRVGFRRRGTVFLASCLLLFALNFLALNNAAMVGPTVAQWLPFSSLTYPDWFRQFVPSLYENFFSIYKSPEPQLTFLVHFCVLYLLLRHAQTLRFAYVAALGVVAALFPFIYVSTGIALLLGLGLYALGGAVVLRHRSFVGLLAVVLLAAAYYVAVSASQGSSEYANDLVYRTRLPIVSVSMLWGLLLMVVFVCHWLRVRKVSAVELVGLVCAVVPFITLNQQVITGQMVQSRTWEYYTNPLFTAMGMVIFWPLIYAQFVAWIPQRIRRFSPYVSPALVVVLLVSQVGNFIGYQRANLDNLAVAEALQDLRAEYPSGLSRVMLENTGDDSQVGLRLGVNDLDVLAGYQQIMQHFITRLADGQVAYEASRQPLKEQAFAYFDRLGLSAEVLEMRMQASAEQAMAGLEVAYLFAFLDSWKPLSDYRAHNVAGMKQQIPALIADYRDFLKHPARRNQFGEVLFVTQTARAPRTDVPWVESLAATRTLGRFRPVTIYIYRQVPRGTAKTRAISSAPSKR